MIFFAGLYRQFKMSNWQPQVPAQDINGGPVENGPDGKIGSENHSNGVNGEARKTVVVVGLGMVGISFM